MELTISDSAVQISTGMAGSVVLLAQEPTKDRGKKEPCPATTSVHYVYFTSSKRRIRMHIRRHFCLHLCHCGYQSFSRDMVTDYQKAATDDPHTQENCIVFFGWWRTLYWLIPRTGLKLDCSFWTLLPAKQQTGRDPSRPGSPLRLSQDYKISKRKKLTPKQPIPETSPACPSVMSPKILAEPESLCIATVRSTSPISAPFDSITVPPVAEVASPTACIRPNSEDVDSPHRAWVTHTSSHMLVVESETRTQLECLMQGQPPSGKIPRQQQRQAHDLEDANRLKEEARRVGSILYHENVDRSVFITLRVEVTPLREEVSRLRQLPQTY